ncbi:cyclin-dependent kinase G-2-like [Andrographis paniculata]|uniref:cyclin-dependent kinase G-2-like n=1 Tax=Andrographis paniculata TaxID=175694 RepID=UPI0021E9476B|nr:cyclin-dependent kinase G-2-like [Andrographis paniculata]
MAAGRHRGIRDTEFKDREVASRVSKKENGHTEGGYERARNGFKEYKRGQDWDRDSLKYRDRVRQKDIKERDIMNGGHHRTSSQNNSGSSSGGEPGRRVVMINAVDREPGELLSEESDGSVDSEVQVNGETDVKGMEKGQTQLSPSQNKKRKFSPIVWDRDEGEATRPLKSRCSSETSNLPALPPKAKSHGPSPNPNPNLHGSLQHSSRAVVNLDESPQKVSTTLELSELHSEKSPMHPEQWVNNKESEPVDEDDCVPMRTIISSRWATDADSPADEGEISNYDEMLRLRSKPGSDSAGAWGRSKSITPEDGEVKIDGSEGATGKSSGSDEYTRSSYRGSSHEEMEMDDDQNYDGSSVHSETKFENSHGSPEPAHPQQRSVNMLHGCRSVDEFEKLNKINEGTYGVVYRARDKKTGEIVALKKVKMEKEREGFPLTSLREINILLSFDHPSIVNVKEVVMGNLDSIFMAMEYMEHDLKALIETMKQPFSQSEVKCLMLQLLGGVKYLHDNWVLHRDLKTSNLLLNNCGELKICDFGLARQYGSPLKPYTQLVVTLWYRAPELLLGAKEYSTAIDMWSVGCIMAELLSKEPLFNGKTEFDQLDKIFRILGTPNEKIWPGYSKLPGVKVNFVKHQYNQLRRKFPATSFTGSPVLSDAGFDLLSKLLTYDPEKRITAEAALNHEWFREVPLPKAREFMPTYPAQNAQDRHVRRVIKSPDPLEELRRKEIQQGVLGISGLFSQ